MRCFVVMGVSGCGKTTIGQALAARLHAVFIDGDDLHPASNVAKMAAGTPLTDADRAPWLARVGETLRDTPGTVLIGCSALKRAYRDIIRDGAGEPVRFLHLTGTRPVLEARMQARTRHFMPTSLLDSQIATLEPPGADEDHVSVDIDQPVEAIVDALAARI